MRLLPLVPVIALCAAPAWADPTTTLIVGRGPAGALSTDWIESDGNAHEVRATFPLPVVADGDAVWLWRALRADVALCDCDAIGAWRGSGLCPTATARGAAGGAQLIRLPDVVAVDVAPPRTLQPGEALAALAGRAELLGVVGPYVFLRVVDDARSCLAPDPLREARFSVWDVRGQRDAVLFDRKEIQALRATEQVSAFGMLPPGTLADGPKGLEFAAVLPRVAPDGLALRYLFTAPVCATCGDGAWSSGTASVLVDATSLPAALAPFAAAPAALAAWTLARPELEPLGWTTLAGDPAALVGLREKLRSLVR